MVLNMIMKNIKHSGFTLLELMVLIAIIGIVTAIGVPSYRSMMMTNELVETVNELRLSMKLARSEAVTRSQATIVCSSTDGSSCSLADGNWASGWIVGIDLNGNGQINEANGELLWVKEMEADSQLTITPTDPSFNQVVTYSFDGWLPAAAGFDLCSGYGATNGFPRREIRSSIAGDPQFNKNLSTKC